MKFDDWVEAFEVADTEPAAKSQLGSRLLKFGFEMGQMVRTGEIRRIFDTVIEEVKTGDLQTDEIGAVRRVDDLLFMLVSKEME